MLMLLISTVVACTDNVLLIFHCRELDMDVMIDQSVVKTPDAMDKNTNDIIDTVEWSAKLDSLFKSSQSDSRYFRFYFKVIGLVNYH